MDMPHPAGSTLSEIFRKNVHKAFRLLLRPKQTLQNHFRMSFEALESKHYQIVISIEPAKFTVVVSYALRGFINLKSGLK